MGAGLFPKGSLDTRVVFGAAGQASTMPEVMPAQASVSNRWKPFVIVAKFIATRRPVAEILERWEHVLFALVLIGLGVFILISGGAFGL